MHYLIFIIYTLLGSAIGLLMYLILRRAFLGNAAGAVISGIIGAVLGGNWLRLPVQMIHQFFASYNIEFFASLIGSLFLLWLHFLVSRTVKKKY